MSLQSALIGFLMSKFFPTPISAQENIVLQTTAVATGTVRPFLACTPAEILKIYDTRCRLLQALLGSCPHSASWMKLVTAFPLYTSHGGRRSPGLWQLHSSGTYAFSPLEWYSLMAITEFSSLLPYESKWYVRVF